MANKMTRIAALSLIAFVCNTSSTNAAPKTQEGRPSAMIVAEGLLSSGHFEGASEAFAEIVAAKPTLGRGWWGQGLCHLELGETGEAIAAFEECAELGFNPSVARSHIGCTYALVGEKDTVFEWLDRSFDSGFHSWGLLERDSRLASLRDDERFSSYGKSYNYEEDRNSKRPRPKCPTGGS